MMTDGSCQIPCYEDELNCNLTIVRIFLAKNLDEKSEPPVLIKLNSIMWHGLMKNQWRMFLMNRKYFVGTSPPLDRTKRVIQFVHISPTIFLSITICCGVGLIISISLFVFNLHFRKHR